MEQKLNLNDITSLSDISESFSHASEDYIFSHITYNDQIQRDTPAAIRFEGVTLFMTLRGRLNVTIGHNNFTMKPGSITVLILKMYCRLHVLSTGSVSSMRFLYRLTLLKVSI